MSKAEKRHDGAVMRLVDNPPSCIEDVLLSAREVNVFGVNKTLIKKPDGLYMSRSGELSLIEYKTSETHRSTAETQLRRSAEEIYFQLGIRPKTYFAYTSRGRFRIEEV